MKRTHEKKPDQSMTSVKPTTLNLQTRPFASSQSDSSQTNEVTTSGLTQGKGTSSENLLEKLISTPISESSTTQIRRKPFHSLRFQRMAIQAKLSIGEPNDKYEQEADATASKVVQQINSPTQDQSVQREAMEEEEELQMKPISSIQREASMEEEDELQMKPISSIQREASMEEEDELQMKPISSIQREASMEEDELQMKSLVQRRENLGGGEASTDLESSIQSARGGGQSLDPNLQTKMGEAMGADFSAVKVHTDSQADQLNKSIQAKAFTTGQDVFFRQGAYEPSSRGGQELIAHELTHVVQQGSGGAKINRNSIKSQKEKIQKKTKPDQPDCAKKEVGVNVVEQKGNRSASRPSLQKSVAPISLTKNNSNMTIQRTYSALSPMSKARVDQQSEEKYASKTEEFEFKMAPKIMQNDKVNAVVDGLLARVKQIVDAWAKATGRDQAKTYEREFAWKGGDEYYGAFEMTAENIQEVFDDKSQPMRTKLKLVYNAVRNNNLAKWLKLAAIELDRKAKNKTPRDWKIKTATQSVINERDKSGKIKSFVKGGIEKEVVKTGFAKDSGLKNWMTDTQIGDFAKTAESEKKTTGSRSKRDVFGHDRFSDIVGWKTETAKANRERRAFASSGLSLDEQRTLTVEDVPDLTKAELELLYKRKGKDKPDKKELSKFKKDPKAKISWGQGGEFYNINLGSDSAKAASSVKARMEAGISGSTDLMLHAIQNLGLSDEDNMKGMRLALAGWMLANRDHSFYEVYKAAESYGVTFEIDKDDPGKEYESANNLSPMKPSDFADTLPENKFPSYFLSTAYKDILAGGLTEATKDQDTFKKALLAQGLSDTLLTSLDMRTTAELSRLSEVVAQQTIDSGDRMAKKNQSIRRIKLHNSFIYLGNELGADKAEAMLIALLKTHHSGKGLAAETNNKLNNLADAGVPRVILEALATAQIDQIEAVRKVVKEAPIDRTTGQLNLIEINKAVNKMKIDAGKREVIKSVLIQTYHGNKVLTEDQQYKANAARMMAGHEESGAKKLTTSQLDDLQAPTPKGGTKISDKDYWESQAAKGKLTGNLGIIANSFLTKANSTEKDRIRNAIYSQIFNNDHNSIEQFKEVEKDEGFSLAVTSYTDSSFIEREVLPPEAKEALTGLKGLHDKELGAIFQYTTALYKPIVNSANNFKTDDFGEGDLSKVQWGSPLGTLKYTGPMMQGISSGLAKLPVYSGKVYRLVTTSDPIMTKSENDRKKYAAQNYKPGKLEFANYPMSAAKSLNSQFSKTNYGDPGFSVVYEIDEVKSGRDIQFVSDKVNEEEVLFPPGSRLEVVSATHCNPNNDKDTHIWVKLREV
ncbi:MAG: hypothetical protein RLZZ139_1600 [Cyanobacteriota bacterium]